MSDNPAAMAYAMPLAGARSGEAQASDASETRKNTVSHKGLLLLALTLC